jgi:hypothetical protein
MSLRVLRTFGFKARNFSDISAKQLLKTKKSTKLEWQSFALLESQNLKYRWQQRGGERVMRGKKHVHCILAA